MLGITLFDVDRVEIYQFKHFLAVVETASFTKAAVRMHITQPALSGSVARLETELGTRLFTRGRNSLALTPAGQRLFKLWESPHEPKSGPFSTVDLDDPHCFGSQEDSTVSVDLGAAARGASRIVPMLTNPASAS